MITVKEIAWVAGIIEGEGCIRFNGTPKITIKMCDKDIIERLAKIFGKPVYSHLSNNKIYSSQYAVYVTSVSAVEWMFTVYSFLGIRKRKQVDDAIRRWLPQKFHRNRLQLT